MVAIRIYNKTIVSSVISTAPGRVTLKLQQFYLVGGYISPNVPLQTVNNWLADLWDPGLRGAVIIAGDFNAKAREWGIPIGDLRGDSVLEWAAGNSLMLENNGAPTYERGREVSHIDLTFSRNMYVKNWQVLGTETLSDHRYILYETVAKEADTPRVDNRSDIWKIDASSTETFDNLLPVLLSSHGNTTALDLYSRIIEACSISFCKKRKGVHKYVYWWCEETKRARANCQEKRRCLLRAKRRRNPDNTVFANELESYRNARRALKREIFAAKERAWTKLIWEIESDTWGQAYRIVTDKLKARAPPLPLQSQLEVARELFPQRNVQPLKDLLNFVPVSEVTPFSAGELDTALSKMRLGKAPGPDGMPPEIVKRAVSLNKHVFLEGFSKLLQQQDFPCAWKKMKMVLIDKGKGEGANKYRPICLINAMAKLFEYLILGRLTEELDRLGGIHKHQFGFKKGKSTVDALKLVLGTVEEATKSANYGRKKLCLLITFDIKNAFNTAPWTGILRRLREVGVSMYLQNIIVRYFHDRTITITSEDTCDLPLRCGVPQGSVLGPTLWNVFYDDVLRLPLPSGVRTVAYADDLALIVTADTPMELKRKADIAARRVCDHLTNKGLELAYQKSECVLLQGRRKIKDMVVNVNGFEIESRGSIRYLGIDLGKDLNIRDHVCRVSARAEKAVMAISRLMPNSGGPSSASRKVLASAVIATVLYAAPILAQLLNTKVLKEKLAAPIRRIAIRVASAYRTISSEAVQVIASIPPLDLLIQIRTEKYLDKSITKQEAEWRLIQRWQLAWQVDTGKASWTKRLIKSLKNWFERKHGAVYFHLTQLLSGHGDFNGYLARFKNIDPSCRFCHDHIDDAEHTVLVCPEFEELRAKSRRTLQIILTPETL